MDSDVSSVNFEQSKHLLDGSSLKPEAVVEAQATSPHQADDTCATEGVFLPLSTAQGLIPLCSSDKNITVLGLLIDNVVASANVIGSGTPYSEDVNVVDSS